MSNTSARDSGLHVAMRLLLGIIAGLIITDLLKAFVSSVGPKVTLDAMLTCSVALSFAALLFVTRVLVDNALYYSRPDAKTITPAYCSRIVLILMDLVSYAACYHIVTLVTTTPGVQATPLGERMLMVGRDIVFIEALHFAWCLLALLALPTSENSDDFASRRSWLTRWCVLSGSSALIGAVGLCVARDHAWTLQTWSIILLGFSAASGVAYTFFMSTEYLGDWAVEAHKASTTPNTGT